MKNCNTVVDRMCVAHHTRDELKELADVRDMCVCTFCVFLYILVNLAAVFCIHLVFLMDDIMQNQT